MRACHISPASIWKLAILGFRLGKKLFYLYFAHRFPHFYIEKKLRRAQSWNKPDVYDMNFFSIGAVFTLLFKYINHTFSILLLFHYFIKRYDAERIRLCAQNLIQYNFAAFTTSSGGCGHLAALAAPAV
jgi:hypothetical protein